MAFDLRGVSPDGYDGEWIRFNVWSWHRIWRGVMELFPEEKDSIKLWYVNASEVVSKETCERIANKIERYGVDGFSKTISDMDLPLQQENIGKRTLYMAFVFEIPAFVAFLKSCNGFSLE
jgi:hypothetical protein